jgi:hypothetical protein|tara:strand:+ start:292 stop:489 length:198 start_codon:yes stop_codon:yes gene_type:complete
MKHLIIKILTNILYLAFFPFIFVLLLSVSLISGVGGVLGVIVYDLYPRFKECLNSFKKPKVKYLK